MSHPINSDTVIPPKATWFDRITSTRARRLGREFVWIGLGQAAAVLGAVVGVRILTDLLSREVYGQLALGMTVATLVNQSVLGPLTNAATRFFAPAREAGTLRSQIAAVRSLIARSTGGILLAVAVLCLGLFLAGQLKWIGLVLAAVLFALLSGYNSVLSGMQNAARQRAIVALHHGLLSWGRFLLAAAMVIYLGVTSTAAMIGYALAAMFVLASQAYFFRRILLTNDKPVALEHNAENRWRAQMFAYAWPFAIWGIPAWAQLVSDRWAIQLFSSTEDVGLYAVLYQLGYYPITIFTSLAVQLLAPVFFRRAGDASDVSRVRHVHALNCRFTGVSLLITGMAVLLAFWLHECVFSWLVAPAYRTVSWLLPGVVLAGGLFASGQFAVISLLCGTQTRSLLAPKISTAVIGVLLNLFGAAHWGVPGVVCGSVLTAIVYLLWILCLVKRQQSQLARRAHTSR